MSRKPLTIAVGADNAGYALKESHTAGITVDQTVRRMTSRHRLARRRMPTRSPEAGCLGPEAHGGDADPDLVNAGKIPVTELPGASYFHHADSFAMMRGGHLDICVLGAYQVSACGDLANWHTGLPDDIPAVGGAMDLALGAKQTFVMMRLLARDGSAKIVPECTYPLTGVGCVSRIYTDLAVFLIDSRRRGPRAVRHPARQAPGAPRRTPGGRNAAFGYPGRDSRRKHIMTQRSRTVTTVGSLDA